VSPGQVRELEAVLEAGPSAMSFRVAAGLIS
jgi:hypothetical protein